MMELFNVDEQSPETNKKNLSSLNKKSLTDLRELFRGFDDSDWNDYFENIELSYREKLEKLLVLLSRHQLNKEEQREMLELSGVFEELIKLKTKVLSFISFSNDYESEKMRELTYNYKILLDSIGKTKDSCANLGRVIVDFFIQYFEKGFSGKESIGFSALKYLLKICLRKCYNKDILEIWKLRKFVDENFLLEIESELIENMFESYKFIRNSDGKKFAAYLFHQSADIVQNLNKLVKIALCSCNESHAFNLGNVYYKVWTDANCKDSIVKLLEEDCLPDIARAALLGDCKNQEKVVKAYQTFLSCFHSKSKLQKTSSLMLDLYNPILWRYLEVPNCYVRKNCTIVAFDFFPRKDFRLNGQARSEDLAKQINALTSTFDDREVDIRLVAIEGSSDALDRAWSILQPAWTEPWIKLLFRQCLPDSSNDKIREHTILCIRELLEKSLEHEGVTNIFQEYLPCLKERIYDVSDRVRKETTRLLKYIMRENLATNPIVEKNELILRLAFDENPTVVRELSELLQDIIFPPNEYPTKNLMNCADLIIDNEIAARRFYFNLPLLVPVNEVVDLVICIIKALYSNNIDNFGPNESSSDDSSLEHELTTYTSFFKSPFGIGTTLNIATLLVNQSEKTLFKDEHVYLREILHQKLECYIPHLVEKFKDFNVWEDLVFLATFVYRTRNGIQDLPTMCLNSINSLENDAQKGDFAPYVLCLHYQQKTDTLLDRITSWVRQTGELVKSVSSNKRRDLSQRLSINDSKPLLAIRCFAVLLHLTREIANKHPEEFGIWYQELHFTKVGIDTIVRNVTVLPVCAALLEEGFFLYCQLTILHHSDSFDCNESLIQLMKWSKELLALAKTRKKGNDVKRIHVETEEVNKLLLSTLETVTKIVTDSLRVGFPNVNTILEIQKFTKDVLETNSSGDLKLSVTYYTKILRELVEHTLCHNIFTPTDTTDLIGQILQSMLRRIRNEETSNNVNELLPVIKASLTKLVNFILQKSRNEPKLWKMEINGDFLATALTQTTSYLKKAKDLSDMKYLELSPFTSLLIKIIMSTPLVDNLVSDLTELLKTKYALGTIPSCYSSYHVLSFIISEDVGTTPNLAPWSEAFYVIEEGIEDIRCKAQLSTNDPNDLARKMEFLNELKALVKKLANNQVTNFNNDTGSMS